MRAVEADDPARNRCGCFLPDLTRLATTPSADFRGGIWRGVTKLASRLFLAIQIISPARHSYRQRVQSLGEDDLARQARGPADMRGQVQQVILLLAGGRKAVEILGSDDDMAGRAGHR